MERRNEIVSSILIAQLVSIKELKPHEEIIKENYNKLLIKIMFDGEIYNPIIIDKITRIILDGHHRYSVAKNLNLLKMPCLIIDYLDDSIISVFPRRKDINIDKFLVLKAGITGKLFPNKSTKHILHVPFSSKPFSLHLLK